jgi:hypothetical protein
MKDRRMIIWGKKIIPQTLRNKQLAVLLIAGAWCSVCCLVEVLNRGAMRHPIHAAVTALLLSAPVLIFCAIFLWWLSQTALTREPLHLPQESEPADKPMESPRDQTETTLSPQTRGYRWGKFQGWVILVIGALDLLDGHPILLGNIYGRLGCILLVITGIGLINRAKEGLVLFFICNGALLAGFLWTFRLSLLSFDFGSMSGAPLALLGLLLAWWLIPAIFYYPKRWKEFSVNKSSKALPQTDCKAPVEAVQPGSRNVRSQLTERLRQARKSFSGTPPWFRVSLVVLVVLMIVACGFALSLPPRTLAKRANLLDTAHHYSLGGILRKLACSRGDGWSCVALAKMYEKGQGVATDASRANRLYSRAAKLYEPACNQGTLDACRGLADLYESGKGVPKDSSRATALYQRWAEHEIQVCDSGDLQVCSDLGNDYSFGYLGAPPDAAKGATFYAKACELGDGNECYWLGMGYSVGDYGPPDYAKAATFYAKGCDLNDVLSCEDLGDSYKMGEGVQQNANRAEESYLKACDLGDPGGCAKAGFLYQDGEGTPRNYPKALGFLVRACDGGSDLGCWALGTMYRDREGGVQVNVPVAKFYFSKACALSKDLHFGCDELKKLQ